jgi:phosphatidylglycerol---prolipoprotein diacylglyceryl transferase
MRQVLFHIPLSGLSDNLPDIPIYGYGFMLFVAFVLCTWLACRLAVREATPPPQRIQDLAIWLFVSGIAGARITFMIQYGVAPWDFYKIWEGGLVVYGAVPGGIIGYFLAYFFMLRKYGVSNWKMADIIAPCFALGLCLGRFGCLFNGCCFGNVACPDCPAISFPPAAPPRFALVNKGYQSVAGFTLGEGIVKNVRVNSPAWQAGFRPGQVIVDMKKIEEMKREKKLPEGAVIDWQESLVNLVEPNSPAERSGLRTGDQITKVNNYSVETTALLNLRLSDAKGNGWPRGKNDLALTVKHFGSEQETSLPAFTPWTIGLHPTQLYESISMALLFALLMAYYPFRRHDGEVMVLFMVGYAVHRFLDEILRADTDPVAFHMTLSQNVSVLMLAAALILGLILWRKPVQYRPVCAERDPGAKTEEGKPLLRV